VCDKTQEEKSPGAQDRNSLHHRASSRLVDWLPN
jgi:hypothetical protein